MRLPIRVATEIRARALIARGQRVLIALSGGPDSVALFHCLLELSAKRDLAFSLCAAHLHHGLRGKDADADEAFCVKLCRKHKIELVAARVDTPALSAAIKRSKEESARIARHAFLALAAEQLNCDCVAVAHHADDRIETVLFRLCRGTGVAGLQGIGWRGPVRLDGEPDVTDWLKFDERGCQGAGGRLPAPCSGPRSKEQPQRFDEHRILVTAVAPWHPSVHCNAFVPRTAPISSPLSVRFSLNSPLYSADSFNNGFTSI